jgi:hypothetical protein
VSRRSHPEESDARLEAEVQAEKAAALRRIGARLGQLLDELDWRRHREEFLSGPGREREREAYRGILAEARLYRWHLEVQREGLGLRNHGRLDEVYPLPRHPDD